MKKKKIVPKARIIKKRTKKTLMIALQTRAKSLTIPLPSFSSRGLKN
jgi:hypothetical protein